MSTKLGPFELITKLGSGGTAEVYLASGPNARGAELVALKVMLEHLAEDEGTRKAFLAEGRTSSLLRHPNIVEVFDVGETDGRAWLVMELVRGWSLAALVKKLKAAKEQLPFEEACEAVRQAALGLHFAHEITGADGALLGLVHRDVSPQNVIVSETGEVKVADFGLAKATILSSTVTRGIKGKLKYMPPEQLKGEALDRRSDVFALGAVLWELVLGQPLYPGASEAEVFQEALFNPQPHPDEITRGLSRALVEVLQKAVARDPERRPQTALALAELVAPLTTLGGSAERLGERIRRHFEPLPKSLNEASTASTAATMPVRRRASLPSPPRDLKAPGETQTVTTVPPSDTQGEHSSPTIVALSPLDTISDAESAARPTQPGIASTLPGVASTLPGVSETLSGVETPPAQKPLVLPWLILGAVGLFTLAVFGGRALKHLDQSTYEEVELPPALQPQAYLPTPHPPPRPAPLPIEPNLPVEQPANPPPTPLPGATRRRPARSGTVTIDANVPALVSLGKTEFGMTPAKVTLPAGRYHLKVATADGALSTELDVSIVAGASTRKTVTVH